MPQSLDRNNFYSYIVSIFHKTDKIPDMEEPAWPQLQRNKQDRVWLLVIYCFNKWICSQMYDFAVPGSKCCFRGYDTSRTKLWTHWEEMTTWTFKNMSFFVVNIHTEGHWIFAAMGQTLLYFQLGHLNWLCVITKPTTEGSSYKRGWSLNWILNYTNISGSPSKT